MQSEMRDDASLKAAAAAASRCGSICLQCIAFGEEQRSPATLSISKGFRRIQGEYCVGLLVACRRLLHADRSMSRDHWAETPAF